MALWARGLILLAMLAVCSLAPGLAVARRFRWSPAERLCASVGLSLFLLYLAGLVIYLTGAGAWPYYTLTAAGLGCAVLCRADVVKLWRNGTVRAMVRAWACVAAVTFLCLAIVRHYSGGLWSGDWWWHYQKVGVFMAGGSQDMDRVRAIIIERPPTMNLVAMIFMRQVGTGFEPFQVIFTWLNTLCVLPTCLIATAFRRRARRRLHLVAALIVCLPLFLTNATYTWTKLMSSFYVIFGIWLYLAGIRKQDWGRIVAAFTCLGFASIVHFVSAPYAAYVLAHYLVRVWWRRRHKWRELVLSGIGGASMILTWFGYVVWRYGLHEAVGANPTILYTRNYTAGQNAMRVARNIVYTIIPHPMRMSAADIYQPDALGRLRDYTFLIYQTNLLFGMGSIGGLVVLYLLHERLKSRLPVARRGVLVAMSLAVAAGIAMAYVPAARDVMFVLFPTYPQLAVALVMLAFAAGAAYRLLRNRGRERVPEEVWFWRGFIVSVPFVAIAGHDYLNYYGLGHIFFHSLALMAMALVAVSIGDERRWLCRLFALGLAVDFVLGVLLQFHLENKVFRLNPDGTVDTAGLAKQAGINWHEKVNFGYTFVGDHFAAVAVPLQILLVICGALAVWSVLRRGGSVD